MINATNNVIPLLPSSSPVENNPLQHSGETLTMLRNTSHSYPGMPKRAGVQYVQLEWQNTSEERSGLDHTSLQGWGACFNHQRTGGSWSTWECIFHINYLELLAATLVVQTFAKSLLILLRIDNITVVAYINHLGGNCIKELVTTYRCGA